MKKKILTIAILLLILGVSAIILYIKSSMLSGNLREMILPELSRVTGMTVGVDNIYLNPFPLFVDLKGITLINENGLKLLTIKKCRVHVELWGLLRKEVVMPLISVDGLYLNTSAGSLKELGGLLQTKAGTDDQRGWRFRPENILVKDSSITLTGDGIRVSLENIRAEMNLKRRAINLRDASINIVNREKEIIRGGLGLNLLISDKGIDLKGLRFKENGSDVSISGFYASDGFNGDIHSKVSMETIGMLFNLSESRKGSITVKGEISLKLPDIAGLANLSDAGNLTGTILSSLSFNLNVKGDLYLESLMELLRVKEPLRGFTRFSGSVNGPLTAPVAELLAEMKDGHIFGVDTTSVRCRISYRDKKMRFYEGDADAYNGRAEAEVEINLPRVTRYTINVRGDSLDSKGLLKLIKWDPGVPPGKVSGFLYSEGGSFKPRGTFSYTVGEIEGSATSYLDKIKDIKGSFSLQGNTITLSDLTISSGTTDILSAGTVDLDEETIKFMVSASSRDIKELTGIEEITGIGRFKGTVSGKPDTPLISGRLNLCEFTYRSKPYGCLQSDIDYIGRYIEIHTLSGRVNDSTYHITGSADTGSYELFSIVDPVIDVRLKASGFALNYIDEIIRVKDIQGLLYTDLSLYGPLRKPSFKGHVEVREIRGTAEGENSLGTDIRYEGQTFQLSNLRFKRGRSSIEGNLSISEKGFVESSNIRVSLFSDDLPVKLPYSIHFSGSARLKGDWKSPDGNIEGTVSLTNEKSGISGNLMVTLKDGNAVINADLLRNRVSFTGHMRLGEEFPWDARIGIRDERYEDIFHTLMKEVPEDLIVQINGEALLFGSIRSIQGELSIESLKVGMYGQTFTNTERVSLSVSGSTIIFNSLDMKAGPATFSVNGDLELGRGYNLTLYGYSYLDPLRSFITDIEHIKGYVDFVFAITGAWSDPSVSGGLSLQDSSIAIKGIPDWIRSISGYAYVDENRLVLEGLTARFASGDLNIKGVGFIRGWNMDNYHFDGSIKDVNMRLKEGVLFRLSGNFSLSEQKDSISLIGDMNVLKALYTRDVKWKGWILTTQRLTNQKLHQGILDRVDINISITGDEDILIDNNIVRAPAKIDLVILGTLNNPSLLGRVELQGGKIFFRNNEFTIIKASADFTDPERVHPFFNITAGTMVKDYRIHLVLEGYVDEFNLALSSEPTLDEVDILSLLTVGQISSELKGLEGGIGASEAMLFLTGELQDTIEERLRDMTGFDRIRFEPYVSETKGAIGPKVTVSKRLLSDRLYVTYTTSLGESTEQFLKLEFFLTNRISLVGERDELGTLSADIKFRWEFR